MPSKSRPRKDSRPTSAPLPITRSEWMAEAKKAYLEAGDDESLATEMSRYLCDQQDWFGEDIGEPRAEVQEELRGRPSPLRQKAAPNFFADEVEASGDAAKVYLVATGETHEGQETYTRHDVRPPLCDAEVLYSTEKSDGRLPRETMAEWPDAGELEAWRSAADELLQLQFPHKPTIRRAATLLQNAYLFASKCAPKVEEKSGRSE